MQMNFDAPPEPDGRMVDHQREPCPHRIVDDFGGAFAMGAIGGTIWHFIRGARNSPNGARLIGAIDAVKVRAPALGGSFAVWGGLFSSFDCTLQAIRKKEDPWNTITSGALTGGLLSSRSGLRAAGKNAVVGGVLLALIEGASLVITRYASQQALSPEEIQKLREEMELAQAKKRNEGLAAVGQLS